MTLGLLAAVAGMLAYGIATVLQAAGARRAHGVAVLGQPLYLLGTGLDAAAWLASLVALQQLPLFAVQAVLAGSLAVTVVLAKVFLGAALRRRDIAAIMAAVGALVVVAGAAGAQTPHPPPSWFTVTVLPALGIVAAVAVALYRRGRPVPMAVLAGIAFSGAALCARTLHITGPWQQLLREPTAWAAAGFGLVGAVALSRALESGRVGLVVALLWVIEVLIPGSVGVIALGDGVRVGWAIPAAVAVAVAAAACVVLATSTAQPDR